MGMIYATKFKAMIAEILTIRNLFFISGVGCLGVGLWLHSPALALTTLGVIFLGVWIVAFWSTAKRGG